jgi:hypothetical protein
MTDGPHGMEPAFAWDGHSVYRPNPEGKSKLFPVFFPHPHAWRSLAAVAGPPPLPYHFSPITYHFFALTPPRLFSIIDSGFGGPTTAPRGSRGNR